MSPRVQSLIDYYRTAYSGTNENIRARMDESRTIYEKLTPNEQTELATVAISESVQVRDWVLGCLACFFPGSLAPFHKLLVQKRILWPCEMFLGADHSIAESILEIVKNEKQTIHIGDASEILTALAWIGDEVVQSAFLRWRSERPAWISAQMHSPDRYTTEAGWELTPEGRRRDLFHQTAFPLVRRTGAKHPSSLRIGVEDQSQCPWCQRRMTVIFDFDNLGDFIPALQAGRISVRTCTACTCFGAIFGKINADFSTTWHVANQRPEVLPRDSSEFSSPFPDCPLVWSGKTRHFMAAENCTNNPPVSSSQIGGIPTWIQGAEYPACPECRQTMQFIGQIDRAAECDHPVYADKIYYAFYCSDCAVTATHYQCT